MYKRQLVCLFFAQFILLGCVPQETEVKQTTTSTTFDLYSQEKVIVQHSKAKLSPEGEKFVDEFKSTRGYYAVYAANIVEDTAAWHTGHSLSEVKKQSLDVCKMKSKNKRNCIIYTSIIPKNYSPKEGVLTLDQKATKNFNGEFKRRLKATGHGAFAINRTGGFGWAVQNSKSLSISEAIRQCNGASKSTKDNAPRTWKKYLNSSHYKCKVIYSK